MAKQNTGLRSPRYHRRQMHVVQMIQNFPRLLFLTYTTTVLCWCKCMTQLDYLAVSHAAASANMLSAYLQ